ncbi:hypothetical protein BGZ65_005640, partial [Modicella reniformis]
MAPVCFKVPVRFARSLSLFFVLVSLHSSSTIRFVHALECTYPSYNTEVQPGQSSVVSWQLSGSDLENYASLTATLYCMDVGGNKGGIWRTAETLFRNRGLASVQDQFQYSVPNCGSLARDVAIRIVAQGKSGTATSQNHACYFMMSPRALETIEPITTPPRPTTTSTTIAKPTTVPSPTKTVPLSSTLVPTTTGSTQVPGSTGISSSAGGSSFLPSTPNSSASSTSFSIGRPYPSLPPLPPLPDEDWSGSDENGSIPGKTEKTKTISATLGGLCGGGAIVLITTLFVLRHRRHSQRRGRGLLRSESAGGYGGLGRGMKGKLRIQGRQLKGPNRDFFLMREEEDDCDDEVAAATAGYRKSRHDLVVVPEAGSSEKSSSVTDHEVVEMEQQQPRQQESSGRWGHDRATTISYPPNAYIEPYLFLNPSSSHQYMYADDDFTMSSMRSSCETSSVVRKYWDASMAARTERRLEGFPSSGNYSEDSYGRRRTPSMSSQSRKADILSMRASSLADSLTDAALNNICGNGTRSATTIEVPPSKQDGFLKSRHRKMTSSVQSYLRRSMSMSLSSLQSTASTADDDSWHRGPHGGMGRPGRGFRSSINTEYLDHLNI